MPSSQATREAKDRLEVKEAAVNVLDALRENGKATHYETALTDGIAALADPKRRLEAARALVGVSHIKGLGDIYIEALDDYDWPNRVGRLHVAAAQYVARHDPEAPHGSDLGFDKAELETLTRTLLPTRLSRNPEDELAPLKRRWPQIKSLLESAPAEAVGKFILYPILVVLLALAFIHWESTL